MSKYIALGLLAVALGWSATPSQAAPPTTGGAQITATAYSNLPRRTRRSYSYSSGSSFIPGYGRGSAYRPNYTYQKSDPRRYR